MSQQQSKQPDPCSNCLRHCSKCKGETTVSPGKLEKLIHKVLKTTPLGCSGESWRCFIKSKHMFLYGASALVFFAVGNTTSVLFEKEVQDFFFPEKTPAALEPPTSAYHPERQEYFTIKAVIRDLKTGEKTAILEKRRAATPQPAQKISTWSVPLEPLKSRSARSL